MGPGMMGGYGMGSGMMHGGMDYGLDLSGEQRKQIGGIHTDLRKRQWALKGEVIDARGQLFELYADDPPDPKQIGAVYGKIFDVRRQMIEAAIDAHNRHRAVLTDEQREQLQQNRPGHRHGAMHGGMAGN